MRGESMMTMGFDDISGKIATLVGEILAKHGPAGDVAQDAELAKLGMTSIDMVELMLGVEADFDILIPPPDITAENFRSIATIRRLVERLSGASAAAA